MKLGHILIQKTLNSYKSYLLNENSQRVYKLHGNLAQIPVKMILLLKLPPFNASLVTLCHPKHHTCPPYYITVLVSVKPAQEFKLLRHGLKFIPAMKYFLWRHQLFNRVSLELCLTNQKLLLVKVMNQIAHRNVLVQHI